MNPRVQAVVPLKNYELLLTFTNQEKKIFDVKPWLNKGIFKDLKNEKLFSNPYVNWGTVVWNDDIDFCPDTLYLESRIAEPENSK